MEDRFLIRGSGESSRWGYFVLAVACLMGLLFRVGPQAPGPDKQQNDEVSRFDVLIPIAEFDPVAGEEIARLLAKAVDQTLRGDELACISLDLAEMRAQGVGPASVVQVKLLRKIVNPPEVLRCLEKAAERALAGEDCSTFIRAAKHNAEEAGLDVNDVAEVIEKLGNNNRLNNVLSEIRS